MTCICFCLKRLKSPTPQQQITLAAASSSYAFEILSHRLLACLHVQKRSGFFGVPDFSIQSELFEKLFKML